MVVLTLSAVEYLVFFQGTFTIIFFETHHNRTGMKTLKTTKVQWLATATE